MLEKRVVVYLDTGATREHRVMVKDDDAFVKEYNEYVNLLNANGGLLIFGSPVLCIYKVRNRIAIEFLDPPPPSDKLSMGFIAKKEIKGEF